MNRQQSNQAACECSVTWLLQNGRSRIQRGMAADGFKGDYPYAGVTVIAENRLSEEDSSATIAVETVRDVFAEGVAFGVEDALLDSLMEAADMIRDKELTGCSAAAIAFSGTHIWYAMVGNCRIYKVDSDGLTCLVYDQSLANELKLPADHSDYSKKVKELNSWLGSADDCRPACGHARIKQDTTYLIFTSSGWMQIENRVVMVDERKNRTSLDAWLANLSRDLKLAYRRQGGALGAVSGVGNGKIGSVPWKSALYIVAFLGLIGFLLFGNFFSKDSDTGQRTDLFSTDSIEEIVQPILANTDTIIVENSSHSSFFDMVNDSLFSTSIETTEALIPDIAADIPLQIVQIGGVLPTLNPDTFAVSFNSEPDAQWENFSPGIYSIKGDTVSILLAERVSTFYPELEVKVLNRIITVRENGVAESASWLSSLSPDSAASTGVIVETRSSVAGGADWIRDYAIFANGNRAERSGEAGGFMGDSISGLPFLRNSRGYRLLIVL